MQYGYDYLRNMIYIFDFTYINRHADPIGSGWIEVKEGLYAHLVPAMSKGVWKGIYHLKAKVKKCFCPSNVQSVSDASGLIRYETLRQYQEDPLNNSYADPKYTLSVCSAYWKVNKNEAQAVLDTISV